MGKFTSLDVHEAENWHYRGEGAANVVLVYDGSNPALVGKVLRLRKTVRGADKLSHGALKTPVLTPEEQVLWAEWPRMIAAASSAELNHTYVRDVLRPLLTDTHVDPGTIVFVSGLFVEALNRNIAHRRPAWRMDSGSLTMSSGIGLLIDDHSIFTIPRDTVGNLPRTITVEMKPKWGFLPESPWIKEENAIKKTVSRFRMHQILKMKEGKIKGISKYCPLDLFSGTEEGILKALRDLFVTPQNNLRIFYNGEEVFGDFDGSTTSPEDARVPLENIIKEIVPFHEGGPVLAFQKLVAHLLFQSNILEKLQRVQKLDYLDIEGSIQAYEKFMDHIKRSTTGSEDVVPSTLETDSHPEQATYVNGISKLTFEECRKALRDYLISATAKDCGIMLALQPVEPETMSDISIPGTGVLEHSGRFYFHKIHFLDLDVKRLKKLPRYSQLDTDIVKAYRSCYLNDSV
ncbi:hypothetical protein R1flu_022923 [Riccia fluitans]|uniref:Inositol-pentakisphosphate 2-kinase n=1 Tax=Riccia fluitans TaxID=41844 RepID=A0ABD1XTL4_9MARC